VAVIFSESFEGSGYENAGWVETVPVNCTVDENSAGPGSLPVGGGLQCLYIENIGRNWNAANSKSPAFSRGQIRYYRFYWHLDSIEAASFASGEWFKIIQINDSVGAHYIRVQIYNDGGTYKWQLVFWDHLAGTNVTKTGTSAVSLDTWYRIELYVKAYVSVPNEGEYSLRIDGVEEIADGGEDIWNQGDSVTLMVDSVPVAAQESYFDLVKIKDDGWVGAEVVESGGGVSSYII
jgi:hypothetical protein